MVPGKLAGVCKEKAMEENLFGRNMRGRNTGSSRMVYEYLVITRSSIEVTIF